MLAEGEMLVSCIRQDKWLESQREDTEYSTKDFCGFPLFLQANVGIAPQTRPAFALPSQLIPGVPTLYRQMY